jgi:gluconolactonase
MALKFELVAGPYKGSTGGLAWDGKHMLFSAVQEERIYKYDPASGQVSDFRKYTGRTNGIAVGPNGSVFGAQEGGRRVIEFKTDGSTAPTNDLLDGQHHNQPTDVAVDSKGRVWFADAFNTQPPYGPPVYPFPDHASILRLEGATGKWTLKRVTFDTLAARALALSPDEKTLYVAEGDIDRAGRRELRAYPVNADGSLGKGKVVHDFVQGGRGIEGLCVDSDGNVIAVGGSAKSPTGASKNPTGAFVYVFSKSGELKEKHEAPADMPMRCAFGDADLGSLYLTTEGGHLYRAKGSGHKGVKR